jgi:hypothetical protein
MKFYIIDSNNSRKGPYSISELESLKINRNTLVWREGLNEWTDAYKLEELKGVLKLSPPPIPTQKEEKRVNLPPINLVIEKNNRSKTVSKNNWDKKKIATEIKYNFIGLAVALFVSGIILGIGILYQDYTFETYVRNKTFPNHGLYTNAQWYTEWGTILSFFGILLFRPIKLIINWVQINSKHI